MVECLACWFLFHVQIHVTLSIFKGKLNTLLNATKMWGQLQQKEPVAIQKVNTYVHQILNGIYVSRYLQNALNKFLKFEKGLQCRRYWSPDYL